MFICAPASTEKPGLFSRSKVLNRAALSRERNRGCLHGDIAQRMVEGRLEALGVDFEQQVPLAHLLVVVHMDPGDETGHVRRHLDHIGQHARASRVQGDSVS